MFQGATDQTTFEFYHFLLNGLDQYNEIYIYMYIHIYTRYIRWTQNHQNWSFGQCDADNALHKEFICWEHHYFYFYPFVRHCMPDALLSSALCTAAPGGNGLTIVPKSVMQAPEAIWHCLWIAYVLEMCSTPTVRNCQEPASTLLLLVNGIP